MVRYLQKAAAVNVCPFRLSIGEKFKNPKCETVTFAPVFLAARESPMRCGSRRENAEGSA
jgi:hypothetical protein